MSIESPTLNISDPAQNLGIKADTKIVIAATVRDCESTIEVEIARLRKAFSHFTNLHWLLIESDSKDKSLEVLERCKTQIPQFNYIGLGDVELSIPMRTERIAHCRNRYLDELQANSIYQDASYLVIADLDGMQDLLTADGVLSCFKDDNWDVLTANQKGPYYDIWALRHPLWSPNDCWLHKAFLDRYKLGNARTFFTAVYSRMLEIPETAARIEVESAFGGLGIYKMAAIKGARYNGTAEKNEFNLRDVSEHVAFHKMMRDQGAKILINPMMINTGLNQHTKKALMSPYFQIPRAD